MAPLNPSEWLVPHAMKGTDPPERHLHVVHAHMQILRHKWAFGNHRGGDWCPPPLKKFISSSQEFNLVSDSNQIFSNS
jgi:hypothetical protein